MKYINSDLITSLSHEMNGYLRSSNIKINSKWSEFIGWQTSFKFNLYFNDETIYIRYHANNCNTINNKLIVWCSSLRKDITCKNINYAIAYNKENYPYFLGKLKYRLPYNDHVICRFENGEIDVY